MRSIAIGRLCLMVWLAAFGVVPAALAAAGDPLGPSFAVDPGAGGDGAPRVARAATSGEFVVVWTRTGADVSGYRSSIYARLYYADGVAQGPEFTVSPAAQRAVGSPAVAMSASGDFVVSWQLSDGAGEQVYVQAYAAGGAARGSVMKVATLQGAIGRSDVAMDAAGDFVVVWNDFVDLLSLPAPGVPEGAYFFGYSTVRVQRYSRSLAPSGASLLVKLSATQPVPLLGIFDLAPPAVAMDAVGNFVVAWEDRSVLGTPVIQARRYSNAGLGGLQFQVNPLQQLNASHPAATMDANGAFVLAWSVPHQTGSPGNPSSSGLEIYARRYGTAGLPQGTAFRVGTTVAVDAQVSIAMDTAGYTVGWLGTTSGYCCVPGEVDVQRYAGDGSSTGTRVVAADGESEYVGVPAIAAQADGDFVVAWPLMHAGSAVLQARLYAGH